jgi:hypothetical protein
MEYPNPNTWWSSKKTALGARGLRRRLASPVQFCSKLCTVHAFGQINKCFLCKHVHPLVWSDVLNAKFGATSRHGLTRSCNAGRITKPWILGRRRVVHRARSLWLFSFSIGASICIARATLSIGTPFRSKLRQVIASAVSTFRLINWPLIDDDCALSVLVLSRASMLSCRHVRTTYKGAVERTWPRQRKRKAYGGTALVLLLC